MTDGTLEGTLLVKDLNPGERGSSPKNFIVFDDKLFFTAFGSNGNDVLWISDGTANGTYEFTYDEDNKSVYFPEQLTICNNKLFFTNSENMKSFLWVMNSFDSNPRAIDMNHIKPGIRFRYFTLETTLNNKLFFTGDIGFGKFAEKLFATDGTDEGTYIVKDAFPETVVFPLLSKFYVFRDSVYFCVKDSTHGYEMWVTDGTAENTRLKKDFDPDGDGYPFHNITYNGRYYFTAIDSTKSRELWRTDGADNGFEKLVPDFANNPSPLKAASNFIVFNHSLYYTADYTGDGMKLYRLTDADIDAVNDPVADGMNIRIFPNPTELHFTISSDKTQNAIIDVYNLTGQRVVRDFKTTLSQTDLELSDYPSGIYLIRITTGNYVYTDKIVLRQN